MSTPPSDCRFTESHEWIRVDGDVITLGVSQYAANELTDVTYVEMQPAGTSVSKGDSIGEIESVKATSDVYAPVDGEIVEVNEALSDDPSALNNDPYAAGWLVKIKTSDAGSLDDLMDAGTYADKYPV